MKNTQNNKQSVISILEQISLVHPNNEISISSLSSTSENDANAIIWFLKFFGVVEIKHETICLRSETASLFIKSLIEYIRNDISLISVWDNRDYTSEVINESNVFISSNFLSLVEKNRKKQSSESGFKPIKESTTVRVAFIRRCRGKTYYLMQYSESVGQYQLIGGIKHSGDASLTDVVMRKISEEIPQLSSCVKQDSLRQIYQSQRSDEEVFYSKKYGVYAKYKTYIYCPLKCDAVSKMHQQEILRSANNRWVTIKEIEKGRTRDNKEIFTLTPNAVAALRSATPNIKAEGLNLDVLLEKTWLKLLLAVATLSAIPPLLIKFFKLVKDLFSS